jgi:DNA-binding response OmpR family regulator
VGDLGVDVGARLVLREGQPMELAAVEFELRLLLTHQAGQIVSPEDMIRSVQGRALPFAFPFWP